MQQSGKPRYRPLKNDGSPFVCCECSQKGEYHNMWYVSTPDGIFAGVYHKDCVDDSWIEKAEYNPQPIYSSHQ